MLAELFNNPLSFLIWLGALVISITIHEFSHALAADRLGDPTPRLQGRLTINPMAHLDPLGTLMLFIAKFGWGKPVQFDPYNLKNPRRDAAFISLAGPASNLIAASICAVIIHLIVLFTALNLVTNIALNILIIFTTMNVILAVFNLIPVHPLDGFAIVRGFLPEESARQWQELERYGMLFLLFLVFPIFGRSSPINSIISPVVNVILSILLPGTT